MQKLIKEPLFHFVLLGILIFALYAFVNQNTDDNKDILIDDSRVEHIVSLYKLEFQKPPSDEELIDLLEKNIRREIFYREALRLHLDENDDLVKNRLAQKMINLNKELGSIEIESAGQQLEEYYAKNIENYKTPAVYSFYQIGFSQKNNANTHERAIKVLNQISNKPASGAKSEGDDLGLTFYYEKITAPDVVNEFGNELANTLSATQLNKWVGPVKTKFGEHLVFVKERYDSSFPELDSIKKRVATDFAAVKDLQLQDALYQELKNQYTLEVESTQLNSALKRKILSRVK